MDQYPTVTLRTRAIFNLPIEYRYVQCELTVVHIKRTWKTHTVSVANGAALLDFWVRLIPDNANQVSCAGSMIACLALQLYIPYVY